MTVVLALTDIQNEAERGWLPQPATSWIPSSDQRSAKITLPAKGLSAEELTHQHLVALVHATPAATRRPTHARLRMAPIDCPELTARIASQVRLPRRQQFQPYATRLAVSAILFSI